ncbi:MAG TPA: serine hydrolase domain-containing protein [Pyrinomonadaceae bacterium]|nr:serine hydrolase domain-containing protein [Pyrinomonadaceae bacterium]
MIRRPINAFTTILLLCVLTFTAAQAQTPDKGKLDQFFNRLAEKNKAMGSLTVTKDGNVLYSRAIGYSQINGTERKPVSPATRYRVGSITKMFTAAMIFQLVEENKLKLTDTLDKFFPQIPNAQKITLAQMLGHRSGIFNVTDNTDFRSMKTQPRTRDEMLALIAKGKPAFEPGEKAQYSNSNYALLGYIVEKAGGKSYEDALKQRITSKIGLTDTYLGTAYPDPSKNEGHSYNFVGDWKQESETHLSIPGGAGAIISTPNDLTKFIQALFDGKIVSKESLEQMKPKDELGLGINSFPIGGKTFYGHSGGIDGFRSLLLYLPEEKLSLAYTSNGVNYAFNNVVNGVVDIYWNKPFEIPTFETVAVSAEVLDKYVGVYASEGVPFKLTITRDNSTLLVQPTGQSAFALEAIAQDKFKLESRGVVLEFDAAKTQLTFKRNGRDVLFTREN